ncbi:hypothetical protein FQZ97_762340 [compost metagenome]
MVGITTLRLRAIIPGMPPEMNPMVRLIPTENRTTDNVINVAFHKAAFIPNSPTPTKMF